MSLDEALRDAERRALAGDEDAAHELDERLVQAGRPIRARTPDELDASLSRLLQRAGAMDKQPSAVSRHLALHEFVRKGCGTGGRSSFLRVVMVVVTPRARSWDKPFLHTRPAAIGVAPLLPGPGDSPLSPQQVWPDAWEHARDPRDDYEGGGGFTSLAWATTPALDRVLTDTDVILDLVARWTRRSTGRAYP